MSNHADKETQEKSLATAKNVLNYPDISGTAICITLWVLAASNKGERPELSSCKIHRTVMRQKVAQSWFICF